MGSARATAVAPLSASDILSQFNAVVTGNFTSNSDVEGRLVIGGNMTGGATFGLNPESTTSSYGAINVYGNASGGYYNVNGGGNVNVGGSNTARFNMNDGGTVSAGVPGGGTFQSSFGTTLVSLSSQLAKLSATSSFPNVTQNTNNNVAINAVPNTNGIAVFDVTGVQLQQMASFNVNLNGAQTVVFDVTGNYAQNANFENMNDSNVDSHVIWNFVDATSVSLQGFGGTVLATQATVTNSSALNGDLVAANFNGSGELHDHAFAGVLPASPAPLPPVGGTVAGLLALAGFGATRLRQGRGWVGAA